MAGYMTLLEMAIARLVVKQVARLRGYYITLVDIATANLKAEWVSRLPVDYIGSCYLANHIISCCLVIRKDLGSSYNLLIVLGSYLLDVVDLILILNLSFMKFGILCNLLIFKKC